MKSLKQFYMIFVLLLASLWNAGSTFAGNVEAKPPTDKIITTGELNRTFIIASASEEVYEADRRVENARETFLRTQTSRTTALPVFHRDKTYIWENLNAGSDRFLRLLLFPNHTFG